MIDDSKTERNLQMIVPTTRIFAPDGPADGRVKTNRDLMANKDAKCFASILLERTWPAVTHESWGKDHADIVIVLDCAAEK